MTLREIIMQLRSVAPNLCSPGNAKFGIRHIYEASPSVRDRDGARGAYDYRELGFVFARDIQGSEPYRESGKSRNDPSLKTLEQHRFIPGDYLDVAFLTHISSGPSGHGGALGVNGNISSLNTRSAAGPPGFSRSAGPSEADRAWGIAGDQTFNRRRVSAGGRGDLLSGSNRVGQRSEISIMGTGRNNEARTNGRDDNGHVRRNEDADMN